MTTSRQDLKAYFRDGEVPSGDNFSALIDSMVHVDQFESWRKTGEIDFADGLWRVYVDADRRFVIDPDTPTRSRPALALWHEGGWAGMQGRVGTYDPALEAASRSPRPGLEVPLNVKADGKWQPIITDLEGCHAFEVVAKVAGPKPSDKQGITRAVALTSSEGSDVSVQQAPAHRSLQRNLASLVLLLLFVGFIVGLPAKYLEKGRAANEAVRKASELVEENREKLDGLRGRLSSDVILVYRKPHFADKDYFVITLADDEVKVKDGEARAIENNDPERLQTKIFFETDAGMASKIIPASEPDVIADEKIKDEKAVKAVRAVIAPPYQKRIDAAKKELGEAEKALEEAEKAPILPRFVERFVSVAKPVGILGIIVIAASILVSHIRHRAAIRVRWRRRRNKLVGGDSKYDLCLRTGRNYGTDAAGAPVKIHYHITRLWA